MINFYKLSEVLHRLPVDSPLRHSIDVEDNDAMSALVAWVEGDLALTQLDMDAPFAQGRPLHAAMKTAPPTVAPFALVVSGNLTVSGDLSSLLDEYAEDEDGDDIPFPHLVVLGSLQARDVVLGLQWLEVCGALHVGGLLWGTGDSDALGGLYVGAGLQAQVALFTDEYPLHITGGEKIDCLLDEVRDHANVNVLKHSCEALAFAFDERFLSKDGIDNGLGSAVSLLNREAVVLAVRANQPVLKKEPQQAIAAMMPMAQFPLIDDGLSVSNLRHAVEAAREVGILPPNGQGGACWWGDTDFIFDQRRTDSDGSACKDSVFITVHKTWDFYLSIEEPTPEPAVKKRLKRMLSQSEPRAASLTIAYRGYTDDGEPDEDFYVLDEEAEEGFVLQRCQDLWAGVLDYLHKAVGQARAGYPLYKCLQAANLPQRIDTLARMPLFALRYNDWDGDQTYNERMGYWEDDVFLAVRPPEVGDASGSVIKFCYVIGSLMGGDEAHRNQCSFLVSGVDADSPDARWRTGISIAQRQGDTPQALPLHAVDHLARLLRIFNQAEALAEPRNIGYLSELAETVRIEAATQLLSLPPYAPGTQDEAIFSAEVLAVSAHWSHAGVAWVQTINDYQQRQRDGTLSDAEPEPPGDPRKPHAAFVLQLARVVNQCCDADLRARFRRRFAFAPDALVESARNLGQNVGPLFWLAPGQAVVRVGDDHDDARYWLRLDAGQIQVLPSVHGLGRSMNKSCWARSDGQRISTHLGLDGPLIAYFSLPDGTEGLPPELKAVAGKAAHRCDQLIPFNNGQRVLLRNPTGVYLLMPDRVQRLHPQDIDLDDGPYTWPKNQQEGLLDFDMGHMALSPDERFIAVGDQDSIHLLLDAITGQVQRGIEPAADYPHHAVFSHDGTHLYLNACHLYRGATLRLRPDRDDEEPAVLDRGWRVYASTTLPGLTLIGCAGGYLSAVPDDHTKQLWDQYIGSSLSSIDAAPDGSELLVGSSGGYLVCLQAETPAEGHSPRMSIGTAAYVEVQRWIFQTNDEPLCW